MSWVAPDACTLPTAEQPLRVAEFEALFSTALRGLTRPAPLRLRLILEADAEVEARVRDLVARESACCSYFGFTVERVGAARLHVDVVVPPDRADVLDELAAMAGR